MALCATGWAPTTARPLCLGRLLAFLSASGASACTRTRSHTGVLRLCSLRISMLIGSHNQGESRQELAPQRICELMPTEKQSRMGTNAFSCRERSGMPLQHYMQ